MMKKRFLFNLISVISIISFACLPGVNARAEEGQIHKAIAGGIYIEGTNVSKMTEEEAQAVVDDYLKQYSDVEFTLVSNEGSIKAKAGNLSIGAKNADVVSQALNYGKTGSLLKRYTAKSDIENGEGKDFKISFTADYEGITEYLSEHSKDIENPAKDATLKKTENGFEFVEGKSGVIVNYAQSAVKIAEYIETQWDGQAAEIELISEKDEPKGSAEELKDIKDLLGAYNTDFSSSSAGRAANVKNGASKINGTVLYPGETLSVYETVSPFSAENGYELAGSYENGTTVQTYGGGICQVSSTLYNAVMRAELEIVTRSAHSMIVSYVEPSMDAAISGTAKDFQFKNNQETPVYIEGYCSGGRIYFNIYGKETRPSNRKVEFYSEITSETEPVTKYVCSADYPLGYMAQTQGAHTGYTARLWKVVTEGNEIVETRQYNSSRYKESGAVITIGTDGASPEQAAAIAAVVASQDEAYIRASLGL